MFKKTKVFDKMKHLVDKSTGADLTNQEDSEEK